MFNFTGHSEQHHSTLQLQVLQKEEIIVILNSAKRGFCKQEFILLTTLKKYQIQFELRQFNSSTSCFGELPLLCLKSTVYCSSEIPNALSRLVYNSPNKLEQQTRCNFIEQLIQNINEIQQYYLNVNNYIFSSRHINEEDIKQKVVEQLQYLGKILQRNQFGFETIERYQKSERKYVDIVVYACIKCILENIPQSYPDYLLRSYYSSLILWYKECKITQLQSTSRQITIQQVGTVPEKPETEVQFNLNLKRFSMGFGFITAIYCLFD